MREQKILISLKRECKIMTKKAKKANEHLNFINSVVF